MDTPVTDTGKDLMNEPSAKTKSSNLSLTICDRRIRRISFTHLALAKVKSDRGVEQIY